MLLLHLVFKANGKEKILLIYDFLSKEIGGKWLLASGGIEVLQLSSKSKQNCELNCPLVLAYFRGF